jgi:hypothetical protein
VRQGCPLEQVPRHSPRYGFASKADKQAARKEFEARERARAASRRQNATALERSVAERRRARANLPLRKVDVAEADKLDLHRYRMAVKAGMCPAVPSSRNRRAFQRSRDDASPLSSGQSTPFSTRTPTTRTGTPLSGGSDEGRDRPAEGPSGSFSGG